MNLTFSHIPVMKKTVVDSLQINKNGIYIDGTFGTGGHSHAILEKLESQGKLYAIDQDPASVYTGKKIKDKRFKIIHSNFSQILDISQKENILGKVNGIVFDLGVSSPQIDDPMRGFSFMLDGPLDMRMNPSRGISAAEWLFKSNVQQISSVLKKYGEERFSKRIAFAIYNQNKKQKIIRTVELAKIIQNANPFHNKFKHPARRTFQAIRIYINQELSALQRALCHTLKILKPGGRLSIISFHSLEDRIVKNFMTKNSQKANIPYGMPITEKQLTLLYKSKLKIIHRIFPHEYEIQKNSRARSAILRTAELKNI